MIVVHRRAAAALVALGLFASSASVGADEGPAKKPQAASTKLPVDMDGVLLEDGRQIEGAYDERANQRWIITPKAGGEPLNVCVTEIVVAEKGGEVDQRGEDSAAAHVWRAAVHGPYLDAMEAVFNDCANASLVERARAVLQRMKEGGAAAARVAKLGASLKDKTQTAGPDAETKAAADEDAAASAAAAALDKGVEWCRKRGFPTAATSMLNEIARLDPKRSADVAARAKALMPESFFFKEAPDAVAQWMKWADALLPSSAQFVEKDADDVWGRLQNAPWTDGATLVFRTRNVLLFIRDMDPAICGRALRLAEQTVRALQVFLHDGEPDVVTSDDSRLEIRIHKNRKDYLDEEPAHGKKADPWSAGYFFPGDGISHFYVDHDRGAGADVEELTRVLTHEFTHHYMSARWAPRFISARGATEASGGPGFWIVEGMAEFVQNQSHHMDEGVPRFDDDRVHGNLATARARLAHYNARHIAMELFTDMDQQEFRAMTDDMERSVWYDQAGALTYFFLQKKGMEMRKKYVRYVSDHYAGIKHVPAWKYFGYASAAELDNDFMAFLATIGG